MDDPWGWLEQRRAEAGTSVLTRNPQVRIGTDGVRTTTDGMLPAWR